MKNRTTIPFTENELEHMLNAVSDSIKSPKKARNKGTKLRLERLSKKLAGYIG